jgi:charged multivesicular body protein 1
MSDALFNKIFEFRQMSKQMERQADKSKNSQDFYTKKVKQAIEQNNVALAKQYGEQALRARKDVTRYRTLSSKINTISSKLQAAHKNHQLTGQMASLVNQLNGINFNSVGAVETLDKFEKMFDNLDVHTKMMDDVLDNIGVGTVNEQEVNELLAQCAEGQANKIDMMMTGPNREGLNQQQVKNQQYNQYNYNMGNNFFP